MRLTPEQIEQFDRDVAEHLPGRRTWPGWPTASATRRWSNSSRAHAYRLRGDRAGKPTPAGDGSDTFPIRGLLVPKSS